MNKIKKLPNHTIERISAGEIVTEPFNIVKELVENSIDANSTEISIFIENNGYESIVVKDNGDGILKEDLINAFKKNYTSKLENYDDIYNINTMGFRGEALNAISNVSEVEIISKSNIENEASSIIFKFGDFYSLEPAISNNGTTVIVNSIFKNMPIRREFNYNLGTTLSKIKHFIRAYAILYNNIRFQLYNDNNEIIITSGSSSIKQTISEIDGLDVANNLNYFTNNISDITFEGFISNAFISHSDRNKINLFINNRIVYDKNLIKIINEEYSTILPNRRFPIISINIIIPNHKIDINVHPNKLNVKYLNESKLLTSLRDVLLSNIKNTTKIKYSNSNESEIIKENNIKYYDFISTEKSNNLTIETKIDENNPLKTEKDYTIKLIDKNVIFKEEFNYTSILQDLVNNFDIYKSILVFKNYALFYLSEQLLIIDLKNMESLIFEHNLRNNLSSKNAQSTLNILEIRKKIDKNVILLVECLNKIGFDVEIMNDSLIFRAIPSELSDLFKYEFIDELLDKNILFDLEFLKNFFIQKYMVFLQTQKKDYQTANIKSILEKVLLLDKSYIEQNIFSCMKLVNSEDFKLFYEKK